MDINSGITLSDVRVRVKPNFVEVYTSMKLAGQIGFIEQEHLARWHDKQSDYITVHFRWGWHTFNKADIEEVVPPPALGDDSRMTAALGDGDEETE